MEKFISFGAFFLCDISVYLVADKMENKVVLGC